MPRKSKKTNNHSHNKIGKVLHRISRQLGDKTIQQGVVKITRYENVWVRKNTLDKLLINTRYLRAVKKGTRTGGPKRHEHGG